MSVIGGTAAAASLALESGLPATGDPAAVAVGSNVVNGSWEALRSGFPRRSRGRLGSPTGSSSDAAGFGGESAATGAAGLAGSVAAGDLAVSEGEAVVPGVPLVGEGV